VSWCIVSADDKENARLIVSQIILDTINRLKMVYYKTTVNRQLEASLFHGFRIRDIINLTRPQIHIHTPTLKFRAPRSLTRWKTRRLLKLSHGVNVLVAADHENAFAAELRIIE